MNSPITLAADCPLPIRWSPLGRNFNHDSKILRLTVHTRSQYGSPQMALKPSEGVLLVAHGTVSTLDDLPEFLARIRRGRPAPASLVSDLRHRYERIGGSPLLQLTQNQAKGLAERIGGPVLVGMRLWNPSVEEALKQAYRQGLRRLCVLPLAPFSVHVYHAAAERSLERVAAELGERALRLTRVSAWGTQPAFVRAQAEQILRSLDSADPLTPVVLTAHSLPSAIVKGGDPYAQQVAESAQQIGRQLKRPFHLAYQSQGAEGGDWLGPDLKSTFEQLRGQGHRGVIVAPFGFLAEHVETLYDLDIEAARWANELGLAFRRVPALNDAAGLIEALAETAEASLNAPI